MADKSCPCGRSKPYDHCCGLVHKDIQLAKTAEDLMRSRYTAFTLGDGDYIFESHYSKTRKLSEKKSIQNWAKSVQWMKLDVLNTTKGGVNDTEGTVEFKAYFIEAGKLDTIHENSLFTKENGHWVYVDAV